MGEPDAKPMVASTTTDGPAAPHKKKWHCRRHNGNGNKATAQHTVKFQGGKEELDGNYFDRTGYGQSDRFMKTVQKMADYIGQDYKSGGVTCTEVMSQTPVSISMPTRPVSVSTLI